MTQIPEGTQFIGISPDVSLVQKRSQLINDESAGYTAFQIAQAAGLATVIDVTYDELVALIDASSLVVGGVYRITDFQTLHEIPNTTERNDTNVEIPIEVLVCIASSTNTLFSQVQSEDYPDDIIYYTVDNTAWKDLQITGQKGCITYRLDPIRNIDVGNGDWRNFIVRRWAVNLTAFGDAAIRWVLWATSVNCGVTNTGATQTFTALDTNLYNVTTNPDGYKDVRLFLPESGRGAENVFIKRSTDGSNNTFLMPNFYCEVTTGTNTLNNVYIDECKNVTVTNELYSLNIDALRGCIITRLLSYQNSWNGYFENTFIATECHYAAMNFSNLTGCTIFFNRTIGGDHQIGFDMNEITNCHIELLDAAGTSYGFACTLENVGYVRSKIQLGRPMSYILRSMSKSSTAGGNNSFKDISAFTTYTYFDPGTKSTIETTVAAATNITLSTATTISVLDMFAGIINLTGSGTVNIDTLTLFLPNNFPVTLKPASGLTISIDQNNVANGFVNSGTITANGTNGEVIVLLPIGDRWKAS